MSDPAASGSFSFRAKRDGAIRKDVASLCSLQDFEHSGCTTKMKQAAAAGGDMLVVTSAEAKKGTEFVIPSAEPCGGIEFLEAAHISDPAFDAPVILLQSVVSVSAGPVFHVSAEC